MTDITLLGREYSGKSVIVVFRFHGTVEPKRMLAHDMLRSPLIVDALSDVGLATVCKYYATEYGG